MNIKQDKTNWKYILIVMILAVSVGGGILWWINQQDFSIKFTEIEKERKECRKEEDCILTDTVVNEPCPPCDNSSAEYQCVSIEEARRIHEEQKEKYGTSPCAPCPLKSIGDKRFKCICKGDECVKIEDETADCLRKYPLVVFEDCIPGEVIDGWWGTILYPNTLDTSDIEHYIDALAPDIVKQAGIASYEASRSTCQTIWFVKTNGEWKNVSQIEFCNYIIDYKSSCNDCLLEWEEGCC